MTIEAPLPPLAAHGAVLGEEVYSVLGEAILTGQLPAGERVRDVDLASRLGISRTPVREALQRLERIGLVEVAANRYTRVSIPTEKLRNDSLEYIILVMGSAVRLGVARCSDGVLADAVAHADDIVVASAADDHLGIIAASGDFFVVMTAATRNSVFVSTLREANLALRRNLDGWHPFIDCPLQRTEEYRQFRDAVAARDGERAEVLLRALHGLA